MIERSYFTRQVHLNAFWKETVTDNSEIKTNLHQQCLTTNDK